MGLYQVSRCYHHLVYRKNLGLREDAMFTQNTIEGQLGPVPSVQISVENSRR